MHAYLYALVFRVNLPPHGMVPLDLACLPYLQFIPSLSQIPCKYHAHIQ